MPSNVLTQIAEILLEHIWNENRMACGCGERDKEHTRQWDYDCGQHADHVASVLVEQLGLTPEWGVLRRTETGHISWIKIPTNYDPHADGNRGSSEQVARNNATPLDSVEYRLVSGWRKAE